MDYNFESIKLVNRNNKLVKRYKENKKLRNRFKKLIKKVVKR
jgi:hypothetical protein|nr:MAG TPA: hypothetical protein [Herelleviridae sp.]